MPMERAERLSLSIGAAAVLISLAAAGSAARPGVDSAILSPFALRVLAVHNQMRNDAAVQPAAWDGKLAAAAQAYATELARADKFAHSPASSREGQGENLWRGTRGGFSLERMVNDWGSEKRMFRAGNFPHVSNTGRWEDVGHYTQIIWPTTFRVGCAVTSSEAWDYLVCRYAQGGNVFGQSVGTAHLARAGDPNDEQSGTVAGLGSVAP